MKKSLKLALLLNLLYKKPITMLATILYNLNKTKLLSNF